MQNNDDTKQLLKKSDALSTVPPAWAQEDLAHKLTAAEAQEAAEASALAEDGKG